LVWLSKTDSGLGISDKISSLVIQIRNILKEPQNIVDMASKLKEDIKNIAFFDKLLNGTVVEEVLKRKEMKRQHSTRGVKKKNAVSLESMRVHHNDAAHKQLQSRRVTEPSITLPRSPRKRTFSSVTDPYDSEGSLINPDQPAAESDNEDEDTAASIRQSNPSHKNIPDAVDEGDEVDGVDEVDEGGSDRNNIDDQDSTPSDQTRNRQRKKRKTHAGLSVGEDNEEDTGMESPVYNTRANSGNVSEKDIEVFVYLISAMDEYLEHFLKRQMIAEADTEQVHLSARLDIYGINAALGSSDRIEQHAREMFNDEMPTALPFVGAYMRAFAAAVVASATKEHPLSPFFSKHMSFFEASFEKGYIFTRPQQELLLNRMTDLCNLWVSVGPRGTSKWQFQQSDKLKQSRITKCPATSVEQFRLKAQEFIVLYKNGHADNNYIISGPIRMVNCCHQGRSLAREVVCNPGEYTDLGPPTIKLKIKPGSESGGASTEISCQTMLERVVANASLGLSNDSLKMLMSNRLVVIFWGIKSGLLDISAKDEIHNNVRKFLKIVGNAISERPHEPPQNYQLCTPLINDPPLSERPTIIKELWESRKKKPPNINGEKMEKNKGVKVVELERKLGRFRNKFMGKYLYVKAFEDNMTGRRPLNMKKYAAIEGQEWTFIDVGDNETAAVWSNVLRQTVHTEESYMGGVGIKGWGSKGQGHPELKELLENTDPLHLSTAFASIGLENECHVDKDAMVNQAIKTQEGRVENASVNLLYAGGYATTYSEETGTKGDPKHHQRWFFYIVDYGVYFRLRHNLFWIWRTDEAHGTCKHDWDRTAGNEEGKGIRNQRCTMALSISAQAYNAMATYPFGDDIINHNLNFEIYSKWQSLIKK
ncbi:hypothetical protein BC829DRAFT_424266, partial [Chytridium lagenaria]